MLFAQAYAINGQLVKASAVLDSLLTTEYRSADLHATAGIVYRARGFDERADHQDQLAKAINPGVTENNEWLSQKIKRRSQSVSHDRWVVKFFEGI